MVVPARENGESLLRTLGGTAQPPATQQLDSTVEPSHLLVFGALEYSGGAEQRRALLK